MASCLPTQVTMVGSLVYLMNDWDVHRMTCVLSKPSTSHFPQVSYLYLSSTGEQLDIEEEEEEEHYADGVKRTLTDEQIRIFASSTGEQLGIEEKDEEEKESIPFSEHDSWSLAQERTYLQSLPCSQELTHSPKHCLPTLRSVPLRSLTQ